MKEIQIGTFDVDKSIKQLLNPIDFIKDPLDSLNLLVREKDCDEKNEGGDCKDDGTRQTP